MSGQRYEAWKRRKGLKWQGLTEPPLSTMRAGDEAVNSEVRARGVDCEGDVIGDAACNVCGYVQHADSCRYNEKNKATPTPLFFAIDPAFKPADLRMPDWWWEQARQAAQARDAMSGANSVMRGDAMPSKAERFKMTPEELREVLKRQVRSYIESFALAGVSSLTQGEPEDDDV